MHFISKLISSMIFVPSSALVVFRCKVEKTQCSQKASHQRANGKTSEESEDKQGPKGENSKNSIRKHTSHDDGFLIISGS